MNHSLLSWQHFDALLRGRLGAGERVRLLGTWVAWQALAAAAFGASLGVYSAVSRVPTDPRFMAAGLVKMPLLLLFTSAITVPSLYVFGALRGLRFAAREFAAMLMVAHTILAAVLGSLAPVVVFFSLTTTSYSFMVLLTVFSCAVAGLVGVRAFVRALNEPAALPEPAAGPAPEATALVAPESAAVARASPAPVTVPSPSAWQLLGWWLFLYVFVGAQMGWILRPFIGHPDKPFVIFREKTGGFVGGVLDHLWNILTGG